MEGRKATDTDLSYRWGKKFQSRPQVKRHVCQWIEKGIALLPLHTVVDRQSQQLAAGVKNQKCP